MKLYVYDHCPFCVRARMIFGLRGVPVEEIALLNDDEATPIGLIGAKQVPILQKPDGSHMGESLDIVRFIDEYAGQARLSETVRPEAQAWFDKVGKYYNRLVMPREVRLDPPLPEFATQAAIDYFVHKKEQNIGSFEQNLADTPAYLERIHADLAELAALLPEPYFNGAEPGMEDIILYPVLRNLTLVKGLVFPAKLQNYIGRMAAASKVPTYAERAL
ncbi:MULTISPECIES: glutaredoxin 2 [Eikenella]|uniref:Glutaredoxin, GrxB family n=1 Tax=Eikenella longinqua TaxID=1795827 RepID=A0A1A9RUP8_9NEIS|nr:MULTISPECIES: glutaredoxin 2 [Eikenella]OAM26760.1 glutaredoxin, GrxB family [Eikenella longinqua]